MTLKHTRLFKTTLAGTPIDKPNGSPVMILAQIGASRGHILQVRNHLEFGLMDHGIDDSIEMDLLFDTVADNQATILLFDELLMGVLQLLMAYWTSIVGLFAVEDRAPKGDGWLNNDATDLTLSSVYRLIVQTVWSALHSNFQNQLLARSNQAIVNGFGNRIAQNNPIGRSRTVFHLPQSAC